MRHTNMSPLGPNISILVPDYRSTQSDTIVSVCKYCVALLNSRLAQSCSAQIRDAEVLYRTKDLKSWPRLLLRTQALLGDLFLMGARA